MKIHFIIEFETDKAGEPKRVKVLRLTEVAPHQESFAGAVEKNLVSSDAVAAALKPKRAKVAEAAPAPIPAEPPVELAPTLKPNSGPQFDPGFLKHLQDAPSPFTRRAIAVATGLNVVDVTQRFVRLKHKGWIEQPAPGLWRLTKTFGQKTTNVKENS